MRNALAILFLAVALSAQQTAANSGLLVSGTIHMGAVALPGATVTITDLSNGSKFVTSSDESGNFQEHVTHAGDFSISAHLIGFSEVTGKATAAATATATPLRLEMAMAPAGGAAAAVVAGGAAAGRGAGRGAPAVAGRGAPGTAGAGFTGVAVNQVSNAGATADTGGGAALAGVNAGASGDAAVVSGVAQNDPAGGQVMMMAGGGAMIVMGPGGAGQANKFHGSALLGLTDSSLDALSYSITGAPETRLPNARQNGALTVTGPFKIPHVFDDRGRTNITVGISANHGNSLRTALGVVPTPAERGGDFSNATTAAGGPVTVTDPSTGQPFAGDVIPASRISPVATGLLAYIPVPNVTIPGSRDNWQQALDTLSEGGSVTARVSHSFAAPAPAGRGAPAAAAGGRGAPAVAGARPAPPKAPKVALRNLAGNFSYTDTHGDTPGAAFYPYVDSRSVTHGMNAGMNAAIAFGTYLDSFSAILNRNLVSTSNLYSSSQNVESVLGIGGVSTAPVDWGLPNLAFSDFTGLNDVAPSHLDNQTWSLSNAITKRLGHHNLRFGGDWRRLDQSPLTDSNPRGTFTFTGLYSGFDLSDFLLGDVQTSTAVYGSGRFYFHQDHPDAYFTDTWQYSSKITVTAGLRYDYASPIWEQYNRLTNLAIAPGFASVTPVVGGEDGFNKSGLNPYRGYLLPSAAVSWGGWKNTTLRVGFSMQSNSSAYANMATALAYQTPFVTNVTNNGTAVQPLNFAAAFPATTGLVENNFGVNPNYRPSYVDLLNVSVQRRFGKNYSFYVNYSGDKGTDLDILRAPNRTPTGLLLPNVVPFRYETYGADSNYNGVTTYLIRNLSHGVSFNIFYTLSKSIDDASSIGGSGGVSGLVAQNDNDLRAERSLSSDDQRNRFSAGGQWQLPLGLNHRWLDKKGTAASLLGDWLVNYSLALNSGLPLTPSVATTPIQSLQGITGSIRPNLTGEPLALTNPTRSEMFNTAAFVAPAAGTYGNAGRYIVEGPGSITVNGTFSKSFRITDYQSLAVNLNGSNLLNHPNPSSVDTTLGSPTFGQVLAMGGMRVISFNARYSF